MQSEETLMERVEGIEPSSPAWKAGVIAFIRYPQAIESLHKIYRFDVGYLQISAFVQVFYRARVGKARSIAL